MIGLVISDGLGYLRNRGLVYMFFGINFINFVATNKLIRATESHIVELV